MTGWIKKWWRRSSGSDTPAAGNRAAAPDAVAPDAVEQRLNAYFDALPPMEDAEEDDRRILDTVWDQHSAQVRVPSPATPVRPTTGTLTDMVRQFFHLREDFSSPRIAWALGISFATIVLASTMLLLKHRETVPRTPIADGKQVTPQADSTAVSDVPQAGDEITDNDEREPTRAQDAPTQDTRAPRAEQSVSFAAIPVVFNLRGGDGESSGSAASNIPIAMELIEAALKRHAIAYRVDDSGDIITDIIVRDASVSAGTELPLRFSPDPVNGVVKIQPANLRVSPSRIDAARLQALVREIRIDIEDELRF